MIKDLNLKRPRIVDILKIAFFQFVQERNKLMNSFNILKKGNEYDLYQIEPQTDQTTDISKQLTFSLGKFSYSLVDPSLLQISVTASPQLSFNDPVAVQISGIEGL